MYPGVFGIWVWESFGFMRLGQLTFRVCVCPGVVRFAGCESFGFMRLGCLTFWAFACPGVFGLIGLGVFGFMRSGCTFRVIVCPASFGILVCLCGSRWVLVVRWFEL